MERPIHNMNNLFSQLGRPSDDRAIAQFIATNRPLAGPLRLHEAPYWTPTQAAFLCEAIRNDADWSAVVDELNSRLHATD